MFLGNIIGYMWRNKETGTTGNLQEEALAYIRNHQEEYEIYPLIEGTALPVQYFDNMQFN